MPEAMPPFVRLTSKETNVGGFMEGAFPRYVWYRDGERLFEGRLTNQVLGEYKGYPIGPDEGPPELRSQDV